MKKSNAIGDRANTSLFTYNAQTKTFVTEMSELQHRKIDPLGQLYCDACDQGFVMVSEKTGHEVEFFLYHTDREADGDLRSYIFKAAAHRAFDPVTAELKVMIVNS